MEVTEQLGLKTKRRASALQKILSLLGVHAGDNIITADMYLDANFTPVWASEESPVMVKQESKC
jgi:hypothetical protein